MNQISVEIDHSRELCNKPDISNDTPRHVVEVKSSSLSLLRVRDGSRRLYK